MAGLIRDYRRAGVPLAMLETADPAETLRTIVSECKNGTEYPCVAWDCVRGIRAANEAGEGVAADLNGGGSAEATAYPVEACKALFHMPERGVAVLFGIQAWLGDATVRQALWNLRDALKPVGALCVLLVPLGYKLPADLSQDIITSVVPLPGDDEHAKMLRNLSADAGISAPDHATMTGAVGALSGLSGFAAEQAAALSITREGLDLSGLWERKRRAVEQTRGLSIYRGGDRFADLGGLDNAKGLFGRVIAGRRRPRCIVWLDEIEKAFAGHGTDTSGVSTAFLGATLTEMQERGYTGAILYGHPGAGKSAMAKATAGEAGIPCIGFDVGAMKGSLVGESEGAIRAAWQIVHAVAGDGGALVLATANNLQGLPAELLARFRLGTLFFDLPTAEEQRGIWDIWRKRFAIPAEDTEPDCTGWVGREITSCCDLADRLGVTLREAASYIVPVCRSSADVIEARRSGASGRYLSASTAGVYRYDKNAAPVRAGGRKLEL